MRRGLFLFLGLGLLGLGCNIDSNLDKQNGEEGSEGPEDAPIIRVEPGSVDFGQVNVADGGSASQVVTIYNDGTATLQISEIGLEAEDGWFSMTSLASPVVMQGSSVDFTVSFAPDTALSASNSVLIASNDPANPQVTVPLTGEGIAPVIQVDPNPFDFGTHYVGCAKTEKFQVQNVGTADLLVEGFQYDNTDGTLLLDYSASFDGVSESSPVTIKPGEQAPVQITYSPLEELPSQGFLRVHSNDPLAPEFLAEQSAFGAFAGEGHDEFEQPIKGATDIIFTLDKSGSMWEDVTNVKNNFDDFANVISTYDADYQVAMIVEDDGCVLGSEMYIDATFSASEAQDTLDEMIGSQYSYGMNTERGFMLAEAAVDPDGSAGSGGCNDGLIREDALLHIVHVSDEVEQSVHDYTYYVSEFQTWKGSTDKLIISAVAGDYPSGCGGNEPGIGYYEATVATGGLFLSICATDFGTHLQDLAAESVSQLAEFELDDTPVESSIVVYVNGTVQSAGWTYNAAENQVEFDPDHVPAGGSIIEVDYALPGECDDQ